MKDFYINILGLEFVSEEKDRYVFLKAGQSMLLIFNPNKTLVSNGSDSTQLPVHRAFTPPSIIHFALEINKQNYDNAKHILNEKNIKIEKELLGRKVRILSTFETQQEISLKSLLQVLGH
jgi:hypothetical protein